MYCEESESCKSVLEDPSKCHALTTCPVNKIVAYLDAPHYYDSTSKLIDRGYVYDNPEHRQYSVHFVQLVDSVQKELKITFKARDIVKLRRAVHELLASNPWFHQAPLTVTNKPLTTFKCDKSIQLKYVSRSHDGIVTAGLRQVHRYFMKPGKDWSGDTADDTTVETILAIADLEKFSLLVGEMENHYQAARDRYHSCQVQHSIDHFNRLLPRRFYNHISGIQGKLDGPGRVYIQLPKCECRFDQDWHVDMCNPPTKTNVTLKIGSSRQVLFPPAPMPRDERPLKLPAQFIEPLLSAIRSNENTRHFRQIPGHLTIVADVPHPQIPLQLQLLVKDHSMYRISVICPNDEVRRDRGYWNIAAERWCLGLEQSVLVYHGGIRFTKRLEELQAVYVQLPNRMDTSD